MSILNVVILEANNYFTRHLEWLLHRFPDGTYRDVPGLVKLVTLDEIEAADWSLTPGRYVGVAPAEADDEENFEEEMRPPANPDWGHPRNLWLMPLAPLFRSGVSGKPLANRLSEIACAHLQRNPPMTPRQRAILEYHKDLATFATNASTPVFAILDLEDRVGFGIASYLQTDCAEKRDAIKATGAYPAFTLALSISGANALFAHGWPQAKPISSIPESMTAVMLISDGRCLVILLPKE